MDKNAAFKNLLFDLDGTLIDSAPDLGAAADKMRVDRGLPSLPSASKVAATCLRKAPSL